jgi:hypothetical protein
MNNTFPTIQLSFRAYFIRMKGHESELMVRVILVGNTGTKSIYERFGTWRQCRRWIVQISGSVILAEQFTAVQKCLELNRLATIAELQVSPHDLESVGFRYAGN